MARKPWRKRVYLLLSRLLTRMAKVHEKREGGKRLFSWLADFLASWVNNMADQEGLLVWLASLIDKYSKDFDAAADSSGHQPDRNKIMSEAKKELAGMQKRIRDGQRELETKPGTEGVIAVCGPMGDLGVAACIGTDIHDMLRQHPYAEFVAKAPLDRALTSLKIATSQVGLSQPFAKRKKIPRERVEQALNRLETTHSYLMEAIEILRSW